MTYKVLKTEKEFKQVQKLCRKYDINASPNGFTIIAVDNDEVVGVITIKSVAMIEPLVSSNPIVAENLFKRAEGAILLKGIQAVRCNTDKKNKRAFMKAGFKKVFNENIILEKIYEV